MSRVVSWAILAALALGGLSLMAVGLQGLLAGGDCRGLAVNDCSLELSILRAMGRKQLIFGTALATLAGALAFLKARPGSL